MDIIDARELTQHLRSDGLGALASALETRLLKRRPRTEHGKAHAMADAMDDVMAGPDCEAKQQLQRRMRAVMVNSGIGPSGTRTSDLTVN